MQDSNFHSLIIDNILPNPIEFRDHLLELPMVDYLAQDEVTYPGIVELPRHIETAIKTAITDHFPVAKFNSIFARYSMESMNPPHWAHSGLEFGARTALIYMNPNPPPSDGTHLVSHRHANFNSHPTTDGELKLLRSHTNDRKSWNIDFTCPAKFNRMVIFNSNLLHAAAMNYGNTKETARLVVTAFFH